MELIVPRKDKVSSRSLAGKTEGDFTELIQCPNEAYLGETEGDIMKFTWKSRKRPNNAYQGRLKCGFMEQEVQKSQLDI